ncbi:GNAT family N-acetyltransferase [Formosa sp. S-31]|uniref:GNAT family N-acetyltransferase n=1 Tax=Formosa sp. S-31 TaxID=2790949 RepID=UPI003EBA60C5
MTNKSFYIEALNRTDAYGLNTFMRSNVKQFVTYLPNTLSKNLKLQGSKDYIEDQLKKEFKKTEFTFTLKDSNSKKIIGLIILKELNWDTKQGEFAYCIDKKETQKGLMTQAIKDMSLYAFNTLQLKTLQIITNKSNIGSTKVATNCGFIWKSTLKNEYTPPNATSLDMELYELHHER